MHASVLVWCRLLILCLLVGRTANFSELPASQSIFSDLPLSVSAYGLFKGEPLGRDLNTKTNRKISFFSGLFSVELFSLDLKNPVQAFSASQVCRLSSSENLHLFFEERGPPRLS